LPHTAKINTRFTMFIEQLRRHYELPKHLACTQQPYRWQRSSGG